jgi:dienelactone hydrolase
MRFAEPWGQTLTDGRGQTLRLLLWLVAAVALVCSPAIDAATGRRVTLRTEDGVTLNGAVYEPSRQPAPGIVLLPMYRRSHVDWEPVASQLADAGFAVLAIDFRSSEDLGSLSADVRAAKAFLRGRTDVIPSRIGFAGASIGANLALIDAAEDPAVQSVALLSPGMDYRGLRTEAAMKKFGARAAFLVGSVKDPYARRSITHLATVGPGARVVRLTEALGHGTTMLMRDPELAGALVDWFRRTLQ